jgi:hypothetical protein
LEPERKTEEHWPPETRFEQIVEELKVVDQKQVARSSTIYISHLRQKGEETNMSNLMCVLEAEEHEISPTHFEHIVDISMSRIYRKRADARDAKIYAHLRQRKAQTWLG